MPTIYKPAFEGAARRRVTAQAVKISVLSIVLATVVPALYWAPYRATQECRKISKTKVEECAVGLTENMRDSLLKLYGGFGALILGYFTIKSYELSVRTRRSEAFIEAIDQIGSADVLTKIGGIYGLGILLKAAEPRDDYWRIMDILSATIRKHAEKGKNASRDSSRDYVPLEVEAALNVIGRRQRIFERDERDASTDLNSTDLSNAYLIGMHFEWAYFGFAVLRNTNFRRARLYRANFDGADLAGADLSEADLTEAVITQQQLNSANGDRQTVIPEGRVRPSSWTSTN
jgi:hypothetical protein